MPGLIVLSDNHSEYLFSNFEFASTPWTILTIINKAIPKIVIQIADASILLTSSI